MNAFDKFFSYSPTFILLGITIFMFLVQLNLPTNILNNLVLTQNSFSNPWSLFTHMFLHGGGTHLLFNMIGLFFFGSFVEKLIGAKRFYLVYFGGGILAAVLTVLYNLAIGGQFAGVGASGALMAIVGATIMITPNTKVMIIPIPVPISLWVAGIVYFLIDAGGFIINLFINTGVGHITHIFGMLTGLLIGRYYKKNPFLSVKKVKVSPEDIIVVEDADTYMKRKNN